MKNHDKRIKITLPKWQWVLTIEVLQEYQDTAMEVLKDEKQTEKLTATDLANTQMKLDYLEELISKLKETV